MSQHSFKPDPSVLVALNANSRPSFSTSELSIILHHNAVFKESLLGTNANGDALYLKGAIWLLRPKTACQSNFQPQYIGVELFQLIENGFEESQVVDFIRDGAININGQFSGWTIFGMPYFEVVSSNTATGYLPFVGGSTPNALKFDGGHISIDV